ncbi:MAG: hypothetical protein HC862_08025 [Scytonema sp. RU_4_4]|nr:hypothetical protein [Scytonema sp. RU_4_4]
MSIPLPHLDDRTYDDLVQEALSLIPTYAPEWTNHNPSDPGITLIELFAYLTEMLNYRLNRVTDANKLTFLKLINGPDWKPNKPLNLNKEIRDTVLKLRTPDRCVIGEDFETLVLVHFQEVARAHTIRNRNLENLESELLLSLEERPGYVSVIIVPKREESNQRQIINELQPTSELIEQVRDYLRDRRLLATRVRVVGPRYVYIGIHLRIFLKADALENDVRPRAEDALKNFLDPLKGGTDGKGWPFSHNVYVSEIYQLLDKLPGVDYVERKDDSDELTVRDRRDPKQVVQNSDRLLRNDDKRLVAVQLKPEELVFLTDNIDLV